MPGSSHQTLYSKRIEVAIPEDDSEYFVRANGAERRVQRHREVRVRFMYEPDILMVQSWAAAGLSIQAVLLGRGESRHYQFEEATPVIVEPFDNAPGSVEGDFLKLSSHKTNAQIYRSPNLLAPIEWTGADNRILPAPGLTVYAFDDNYFRSVRIYAKDFGGANLADSGASGDDGIASLTLPDETYKIHVTGDVERKPILTTVPIEVGGLYSGFTLDGSGTGSGGDPYHDIGVFGDATLTSDSSETRDVPGLGVVNITTVDPGPPELAAVVVTPVDKDEHPFAVDMIVLDAARPAP